MFGTALWFRSGNGGGSAAATSGGEAKPAHRRRRIGVALGGGAARGWAHIGVIRALAEIGLKPDIIAGTSIGAVVGGCYVAGLLDNLEEFARSLTRRRVFGLLDLNFGGSGLISGNRLSKLIEDQLHDMRIEDLPQRYVCVATELGTGHEIWMARGSMVHAMRASYALPGIFQPVNVNGRWLVDGALVNPVPVTACRALGANIVIAVNLSSESFGRGTVVQDHSADPIADRIVDEVASGGLDARKVLRRQLIGGENGPPGISAVMVEAFNIIQDRISRSRLAGDPPDLTIVPKTVKIGLFEFHRAAESIEMGYEACRKMSADLSEVIAATS